MVAQAQPRPPSKPEGEGEEKPMKQVALGSSERGEWQAQGLREEVQGMSKSLEALRNQSAEDHQA